MAAKLELRLIWEQKASQKNFLQPNHTPYSYKRESAPRQLRPSHHHMVPAQKKTARAGEMFTDSGVILHACPFKEIGEDSFQILVGSHRPRQSGSQQEATNMYKWAGTSLLVQWRRHRASNAGGPGSIPGQGTRSCLPHLVTPWTAAHQAPPSMGIFRHEYWSGVPLPSPSQDAREKLYCVPGKGSCSLPESK